MAETSPKPLLHILVVGFHHKKGCQVEFSYPALASSWKYFPTLALPDGSHNFSRDSVYFNLPSLSSPSETIFGVSCYRQIPVEVRYPRPSLFPIYSLAVTHFFPIPETQEPHLGRDQEHCPKVGDCSLFGAYLRVHRGQVGPNRRLLLQPGRL